MDHQQSSSSSSGIVSGVKSKATEQLSAQKGRATDGLDAIASAVRQSTTHLRSEQHDTVAQYAEKAAEQLERLSASLRNRDVDELLRDVQGLARRQPALVIGGSFVAGMLAARFLKSSRQTDDYGGRSFDSGYADRVASPTYGSTHQERF